MYKRRDLIGSATGVDAFPVDRASRRGPARENPHRIPEAGHGGSVHQARLRYSTTQPYIVALSNKMDELLCALLTAYGVNLFPARFS